MAKAVEIFLVLKALSLIKLIYLNFPSSNGIRLILYLLQEWFGKALIAQLH